MIMLLGLFLFCGAAIAAPKPQKWYEYQEHNFTIADFEAIRRAHEYAAVAYCSANSVDSFDGRNLTCPRGVAACASFREEKIPTVVQIGGTGSCGMPGFVAVDHKRRKVILALRGSVSIQNDISDAEFLLVPSGLCRKCEISTGFNLCWNTVKPMLLSAIMKIAKQQPSYEIDVIGHSLGAAGATIAAAELRCLGLSATLYSFSSPRVGNGEFADFVDNDGLNGRNYRVTHLNDWVVKVPPWGYSRHIRGEYYITSENGKPVKFEDMKYLRGVDGYSLRGGTEDTNTTDFTFRSHSWIFDDITECAPDLFKNAEEQVEGYVARLRFDEPSKLPWNKLTTWAKPDHDED